MSKGIYKLSIDCGRNGDLDGIFVDTEERVNKLIDSGVEVYFGEVLGKHSEVYGPIEKGEITLLTNSEEAVRVVEEHGLVNGYNPFEYTSINFHLEGEDLDDLSVGEIIDMLLERDSK